MTTDGLAREATVSKATIYKAFPSMAALFTAVVEREVERFDPGPLRGFEDVHGLRACLIAYGTNLLGYLNQPDVIGFSRLMLEQARAHPGSAARFFEAAYESTLGEVAGIVAQGQRRGLVAHDDPMAVAEAFLGALEGFGMLRAHHGVGTVPYPDPDAAARLAVRVLGIASTRPSPHD